jgi:hypothetical protein
VTENQDDWELDWGDDEPSRAEHRGIDYERVAWLNMKTMYNDVL